MFLLFLASYYNLISEIPFFFCQRPISRRPTSIGAGDTTNIWWQICYIWAVIHESSNLGFGFAEQNWILTRQRLYCTVHMQHLTDQTYSSPKAWQVSAKSWANVFPVSESVSVCVCTWCLFACRPGLRLLFEDVIALLLSGSEWPRMDLRRLFSSQWPVQIVNRSPMNCGFSGFVSLQTRFYR